MSDENLPRGPSPMTGLWPKAINREILDHPVESDEQASMVLDWCCWLEERKAALEAWYKRQLAEYDKALDVLAECEAVKSLAEYVKKSCGGKKSLELPAGIIKIRKQRDVLSVYNTAEAMKACPEACYTYAGPPAQKLSREKLREAIKAKGGKLYARIGEADVLVAEVQAEVETIQTQPSALPHGESVVGLLEEGHETENEP